MLSKESDNPLLIANSYLILGKSLRIFGVYQKAVEYLNKSSDLYEDLNNTAKWADNQIELGETYRAAANKKQALANINLGLEKFRYLGNSNGICKAANRLAAVYLEIFFDRRNDGKKDTISIADSINKYIALSNQLAAQLNDYDILISNYNILGSFYNMKSITDSALNYLNIAYEISKQMKKNYELPMVLANISRVYDRENDLNKAIYYSNLSLEIARKYKITVYMKLDYEMLSNIYQKWGDNKTALLYLDSMRRVQLDLFTNDVNVKAYLLWINYENDKNRLAIAGEKTRMLLLSLITGLIISIFIIIIFFF